MTRTPQFRGAPGPACPCGGGEFARCCGPFLAGDRLAHDALTLMRSRYTAYTRRDAAYLIATWHPDYCPADLEWDDATHKWLGLTIKHHTRIDDDHAQVEFVAYYRMAGRGYRMAELSRFERVAGRWLYMDGQHHPTQEPLP